MTYLVAGLILFIGAHMTRVVADGWRTSMIARLGEGPWKGIYALTSLAGLALIVWGFGVARQTPEVLWTPPPWGRAAAAVLMLVSMILLAASHSPKSHIKVAVRHPMLASVIVFSVAHLLANRTLADAVLFGSFLAWSVINYFSCLARDRRNGVVYGPPVLKKTVIVIVAGTAVWLVIAMWLHLWLIGVSPMARG
jgi:uncharacterized membrane protein